MKSFRRVLFWMHLIAGATAGIVIFVMSVTGALLAFERQITDFGERDVRFVAIQPGTPKLTPNQVVSKVKVNRPEAEPSTMSISDHPGAAWVFSLGRDGLFYVDPYTGEIIGESNKTLRGVMSELRNWHRWMALSGDQRPIGKAITGASNLLFLFLAISGIYIWFPRNFSWKTVRPVIWFRSGMSGKARNFNWHNTIGFWMSLLLIIFTLTATVISYQWASNLLYTLTGSEVPATQGSASANLPEPEKEFEFPRDLDALWSTAEACAPHWRSISLRLPVEKDAAVFTIDEGIYWNMFGRSALTVDTATAAVAKWEPYGEQSAARQLRSWFRFTHTGETGGIVGQFVGFIACVGGAFLVWTGISLALRRLGNWRKRRAGEAGLLDL